MRRIEGKEETKRGQEEDVGECSETHDNTTHELTHTLKHKLKTYPTTCMITVYPRGWFFQGHATPNQITGYAHL